MAVSHVVCGFRLSYIPGVHASSRHTSDAMEITRLLPHRSHISYMYALHPSTADQFKVFESQSSSRTVGHRRCLHRDRSSRIGCWVLWLETYGFSLDKNLVLLNGTDAFFGLALPREIMSYTCNINNTSFTNYHIRISL